MNEHKYLNTLAHVHQIRLDLKQTQDKYNKMAADLQKKLEEKQKKCNEIKFNSLIINTKIKIKFVTDDIYGAKKGSCEKSSIQ